MEGEAYRGPLAGIRVVDFGHYFAGPMAAMLLADQGASVVRIARPGEPELAAPQYRLLNRNKKLLTLDLKEQRGHGAARALALQADVVIESYRPGVMARLGLDHESLREQNPGLVYLSLPGFPSTDPERSQMQGWEGVVSAAASLFTSGLRQKLRFPPLYIPVPACSAFGSMHGAIAVLSALCAREETQCGTSIEVPLVNAGISSCSRSFVYDGGGLRAAKSPDAPLPAYLESLVISPDDDDQARRAKAAKLRSLAPPVYTVHPYRTSDDRRLLIMPIKPEMATRFFAALGLETQVKLEGFINESPWEKVDLGRGNNLGASWNMSRENSEKLIEWIGKVIATKPASYWEETLGNLGVPIGCLRTRDEWLGMESLHEAGLLTRMSDGESELVVPGRVADISGPGGALIDTRCSEPEEIALAEAESIFGAQQARSAAPETVPQKKSALLAGLKVLDLCNVVAGPNAAYTLAQFGAEVIRCEPPKSFNLPMHLEWTLEVNQGKRSMIVDVKAVPGREVLERLVRWADVVLHNRLDPVAERLGLGCAQLQAINPQVVVAQNSAYGGTHRSSWDLIPGYDPMPNLASGLDALAGRVDEPRPMSEIFADLMSGLGTGFAALLGVFQQRLTGCAGEGRSSLARAANFYQFPYMIADEHGSDWGQGSGPEARGDCWWQRMYECRDDWLYVGASPENRAQLCTLVCGRTDAEERDLAAAFAAGDMADWIETLRAAGIACHPVLSIDDLCAPKGLRSVDNATVDETAAGPLEVLSWTHHPCGLRVVLPAPAWVQVGEDHSYRRLSPAPRVGAHTREILSELGYDEAEIARLFRLGVAHDYLPALGDADRYFHEQERAEAP